jgi:hypothetical protein
MMRTTTTAIGFLLGLLLTVPCMADTINLISNGSFETYGVTNSANTTTGGSITSYKLYLGTSTTTRSSDTALPGWTATRTNDDFAWFCNSLYCGTVPDGTWALCLTGAKGSTGESISQSFSVQAGATYTVSYSEKYRSSGGFLESLISAQSGALTLVGSTGSTPTTSGSTITQATLATTSVWTTYSYSFTASEDTTATLTFQTGDATSTGAFLDNVVLSVPEPSTTVMMVSGIAGLLAFVWRKRRRK